jgi:hypothetical protein
MSKNFLVSFCLGCSLVMFAAGLCVFTDFVHASSEPSGACAGGCTSLDDGSCSASGGNCSGSVNGTSCGCHTATDTSTATNSCGCTSTGYNGNT